MFRAPGAPGLCIHERTLEKWEQRRAKPNPQAAALVLLTNGLFSALHRMPGRPWISSTAFTLLIPVEQNLRNESSHEWCLAALSESWTVVRARDRQRANHRDAETFFLRRHPTPNPNQEIIRYVVLTWCRHAP